MKALVKMCTVDKMLFNNICYGCSYHRIVNRAKTPFQTASVASYILCGMEHCLSLFQVG